MPNSVDMEKNTREVMRWRILRVLYGGSPWPVGEGLLHAALDDAALRVSPAALRKELDYLERKGLLTVHQREEAVWLAALTSDGTDVAEYTAACPPGIKRPAKWY
ncbi:MAG: hypothetical protein Q4G71_10070 [Pseudomonadota bacterium]|nr:hypothetical protein [Pseudomonadota bacterium]